jgi:hypothetical protein
MLEDERRRLSALIWLAGVERLPAGDTDRREALKSASEWRLRVRERREPDWQDAQPTANDQPGTSVEFPDDAYYTDADPRRDDRIAMRNKLDDLIARIERDIAREAALCDGAVAPDVADDAGGADKPASG